MIKVEFYKIGTVEDKKLAFAVICSEFESKWIWVKHKARNTWEIPGGRREVDEDIFNTAKRELFEETGATDFELSHICEYSVTNDNEAKFGALYYAKIKTLNPVLEFEIEQIKFCTNSPHDLTYPAIQPYLFEKVINWKNEERKKVK